VSYARAVARGVAANRWKRGPEQRESTFGLFAPEPASETRQDPRECFDLRRTLEQMRALSPVAVEALVLTEVVGFTNEEAALRQGVPLGTLKTRLRSLRQRLRAAMEAEVRAPEPEVRDQRVVTGSQRTVCPGAAHSHSTGPLNGCDGSGSRR
jgi:DNA-directed RNA polymerase specialized sigma24 family protein